MRLRATGSWWWSAQWGAAARALAPFFAYIWRGWYGEGVLDDGFLDGALHAFDLAVGPGMLRLGEAVLDAVCWQRMSDMWVT